MYNYLHIRVRFISYCFFNTHLIFFISDLSSLIAWLIANFVVGRPTFKSHGLIWLHSTTAFDAWYPQNWNSVTETFIIFNVNVNEGTENRFIEEDKIIIWCDIFFLSLFQTLFYGFVTFIMLIGKSAHL